MKLANNIFDIVETEDIFIKIQSFLKNMKLNYINLFLQDEGCFTDNIADTGIVALLHGRMQIQKYLHYRF